MVAGLAAMIGPLRRAASRLRYALPGLIEALVDGPDAGAAGRLCVALERDGLLASAGYFQRACDGHDVVMAANLALIERLTAVPGATLALKAPALGFDRGRIGAIADMARTAGLPIVLDAHGHHLAQPTLDLVGAFPGIGCALPARWQRTLGDAARLRDEPARLRVVQGEWADPAGDAGAPVERYLAIIAALAGRSAPVAVATHDPALARRALALLVDAGTPGELEQLRGLPRRRTMAVARAMGVPVRIYVPFGPGWWPYAADKALARPYLPLWWARDRLGMRDKMPGGL
jgi:proline dehydrogenase